MRGRGAERTRPARFERCGERAEIAKRRRGSRRQDDAAEERPETAGIALERQHACRPGRRLAEGDDLDVRRHLILQRPARATHQHLDRVPARRQGARQRQHGLLDPAALEVVEVEGESSAPRPRAPLSAHAQLTHPGSAGARSLPARSLRLSRASVNRPRPEPKADVSRVCNRPDPHQTTNTASARRWHDIRCAAARATPTSSTCRSCIPGITAFGDGATASGICAAAAPSWRFGSPRRRCGDAARADGLRRARGGDSIPTRLRSRTCGEPPWRDMGGAAIKARLHGAPRTTADHSRAA